MLKGNGLSIRLRGRSGLQYSEGDRTMNIDAEMLTGAADLVVYPSSIGLWSDGTTADEDEKKRVLGNIQAALTKAGIKADFE
ncbi:MAG: hypothetical protein WAU39_16100 [Polyangiales bacterium]